MATYTKNANVEYQAFCMGTTEIADYPSWFTHALMGGDVIRERRGDLTLKHYLYRRRSTDSDFHPIPYRGWVVLSRGVLLEAYTNEEFRDLFTELGATEATQ